MLINDDPRSEDRLTPVVAQFRRRGLDVRMVRENRSVPAARHRGTELTSGAVLLHLDSDMCAPPGLLAQCRHLIEERGLDALVIPEVSVGQGFWARCKVLEKRCHDGDASVESLRCLRRDLYDRVGGYDPTLHWAEDKDLDLRVRATGARLGTTGLALTHDEGAITLGGTMRKKAGYAATARRYAAKHPAAFAGQANPFRLVRLAVRGWRLSRDPVLVAGLMLLKGCEFLAAGLVLAGVDRSRRG